MTSPRPAAAVAAAVTGVAAGILLRRMSHADPGRSLQRPPSEPAVLTRLADWIPAPPRTWLGRVLAYAWAAPLTAVGCVLGWMSRSRARPWDGVLLFTSARGLMGAMLRRRQFSATTLGHAVITTAASPSPSLLAHELVHTRQAERLGLCFGPVYVALLGRYGYWQHPLERAARKGAKEADR